SADFYDHYQDPFDRLTSGFGPVVNGSRPWTLSTYTGQTQMDHYLGIADTTASTACTSCRHDQTLLDNLGRLNKRVLISDPDGQTTVTYSYDTTGRVVSVSNPARSSPGPTDGVDT